MFKIPKMFRFIFVAITLIVLTSFATFATTSTSASGFFESVQGFLGIAAIETPVSTTASEPDVVIDRSAQSLGCTVCVNPGAGGYFTLSDAFAAINGGTHTGAITIDIFGDTIEPVGGAILNASGVGAASYTSIMIAPSGGAARTISGAATAGLPLIDFNGADFVTINGLNTGGNSLTISNTTVSSTSGTSTIRFQTDATNNLITNSSILGSATMAVGTNGGNIWFGSAAISSGNDNNTVSNNNIGPAGANLPSKAIYFSGSSNTDPGTANSGITINNNNIFDYFSATVASAGIDSNSGTIGTVILNNKFYQTGIRTQTTAAQHSGIRISNTSGNSYQITGNTIGFAAANGTGIYTFVGFGATSTFVPINLSVGTTTATSVQGNTIAGIAMSGTISGTSSSASFRGIYVSSGLATVGDVTGNTIGSQLATGSITWSSSSTSAGDVIGIFNFGSSNFTSNNNTVGGITASNSSTGAANIYGIRCFTSSAVTWTVLNNTVGGSVANSLNSTSTATGTIVQGILNSSPIGTFSGNTIRNLTTAGGTGTTTTASVAGIVITATSNQTIGQNTIFNLTNSNTTAATVVTGIQFNGGAANVVERNFIHSLTSATNSVTAEVNGIRVAGGTTQYRNNMIAIGAGTANAIGAVAANSSTTGINGINEALGTNQFFHNSVYIGGTAAAGTGSSYAFNGTQVTVVRSFRDNIFFNARANGGATGVHYAIKLNGTAANPTGLTINNNLYFANGSGAVHGFYNSLPVANLGPWKTAIGQDAASFESNPQYNDPTNAIPDLHIHPTNPTVAEGNGTDVGVTLDFDGQTRSGLTPVDIGADAGNFVGIDLAAPVISYTAFINTSSTGNRILSVNLTDVTGVATAGLAPRIYFNKNATAYTSTPCALASGTVNNGNWDCTIDNSLVGGVVVTDVIRYHVVAQDTVGNLASNPSAGFAGTNVNTVTTPPTTPNQYTIVAQISGSFNVGTGETYTSLTNAGGIFEFINNSEVVGNITINVTSDLAGELGTNALNQFASPFVILIKPSGSARSVTGTTASNAMIRTNGASRVTIDGSLSGGTDRSLTIENTSVTAPQVVRFGSLGAAAITNNTLKNCIVRNGINTSSAVVVLDNAGTAGTFNNITIQNNDIQKAFIGIFTNATVLAGNGSGLLITQNKLDTSGANAIRNVGIYVQGADGATVSQNAVGNLDAVSAENDFGIWFATGTANSTISANTVTAIGGSGANVGINVTTGVAASNVNVVGNTVSNIATSGGVTVRGIGMTSGGSVMILRNNVTGVNNTNTGTFGAYGMDVSGGDNNIVRNNFVSNVTGDMTGGAAFSTTFGIFGIRVGSGINHQIYNNSVNLYGLRTGTATTSLLTAAFAIVGTTSTGMDVRNNVFANNITGGTTSIANVSVYLPSGGTSAMNLTMNKNAYFYGTDVATAGSGQAGTTAGTNFYTTLPTLAAYTSTLHGAATNDNMSQAYTTAVPFLANTDLHIADPISLLLSAADAIGSVTIDFDGDPRPASAPDIGADEVVQATASTFPAGTFYNAIGANGDVLIGNATITNSLTLTGMVSTGSNTLTLGCNATVTGGGTTNYVIGNLAKQFCATTGGTPFLFPVGTVADGSLVGFPPEYSPFTADVTAIAVIPSTLTVSVVDATLPGSDPLNSASRYWDVTETGELTADIVSFYLTQDINGAQGLYNVLRRSGGMTAVYPGGTVVPGPNSVSAPGVTEFSQWAAGVLAPTAANVTVGGRVVTSTGRGIYGARIVMNDPSGDTRLARTNPFGYYRFDNVGIGETYVFSAFHKQYQFVEPSIVRQIDEATDGIIFVASGIQNDVNPNPTYFDKTPFDFDGDGISDASVWRAETNSWIIKRSSENNWYSQVFGIASDKLAPADFDGDGRTDFAVFRPSEGKWYILLSNSGSLQVEDFGAGTDVPIPSDFDGDGKADIAIWRAGKNVIAFRQSSNGETFERSFEKIVEPFTPRIGDFDGDGKADIAIFSQKGRSWDVRLATGKFVNGIAAEGKGDVPLFADFDGDSRADLGVYDPATGIWTVKLSRSGEVMSVQNGGQNVTPVIGDFDGDGKTDAGVYQNGTWSIRQSVTNLVRSREFGLPTDQAIPSTYIK